MTDTYAEELLINKFLKLEGLVKIPKTEFEQDEGDNSEEQDSPKNEFNNEEENKEYFYPEVALPNESFIRPEDGYWYEIYLIPAIPNQIELGSEARSRWTGIMQINICVPKDSGTKALNARYDAIASLFRSGLYIEGVRIVRTYRTSALDDGDFTVLPVSVEWWADLDR